MTLTPISMKNKILTSIAFFAVVALIYFVFSEIKSCQKHPQVQQTTVDSTAIFKAQIKIEQRFKDSLLVLSKKTDTTRAKIIIKYRWLKGKTDTVPCAEILPQIINVCDSIIYQDSTQITILKAVISKDSSIISNYQRIVVKDSLQIVDLNKQVRRHKRQKKAILIGAGITIGALIVR
jgi:hypothetical protein